MRIAVVVAGLFAALTLTGTASAAQPVQRLVYTKAVTYLTAESRARHLQVKCDPYSANGLTARYTCTFGDAWQIRMHYGGQCALIANLYSGPKFTVYAGLQPTEIALCRAGWQKDLPTPWSIPAA